MFGKSEKSKQSSFAYTFGSDINQLLNIHQAAVKNHANHFKQAFVDIQALDKHFKYDDIFILKFVLACKGDEQKINQHINEALEFRKSVYQYLVGAELHNEKQMFLFEGKSEQEKTDFSFLMKELKFSFKGFTDNPVISVQVAQLGSIDMKKIMSSVNKENVMKFIQLQREAFYRMSDKKSREMGKIVMLCQIMDVKGFSLFGKKFDRKFLQMMKNVQEASNNVQPLMLGRKYMVNAHSALVVLKSFMSSTDNLVLVSSYEKLSRDELVVKTGMMSITGLPHK